MEFLLFKKAEKHYYETKKAYVIHYKGLWFEFKKEDIENSLWNTTQTTIKKIRNAYKQQHTYETIIPRFKPEYFNNQAKKEK